MFTIIQTFITEPLVRIRLEKNWSKKQLTSNFWTVCSYFAVMSFNEVV